jgi:23S rRNA (cytosine1962-C5)-methyltransferase
MTTTIRVSPKGAARWVEGHPWIYRTDVLGETEAPGVVHVEDRRGKFLGQALWSPKSEIRLRLLEAGKRRIDAEWWRYRIAACLSRREGIDANACRVVHGEGDGLPSLVVDRYDRWAVVQLLSAGLETMRADIIAALVDVLQPEGILLRNDASVRKHEGLTEGVELVYGTVPESIEVREGGVKFLAAPWSGQKTGAFLDQRDNRVIAGALAKPGGTALDCFAYHGSFAMHLAKRAGRVTAVDQSKEALVRGTENAVLNGLANIDWVEADAFELVRSWERAGRKFDTIVVDPPAFAKSKSAVAGALRGYHEINLRAMKLLAPGGTLITASCSFHVQLPLFLEMLSGAASDSGRRLVLARILGQGQDHPEIVTVPETGYLKGAVLVAQ